MDDILDSQWQEWYAMTPLEALAGVEQTLGVLSGRRGIA